MSPAEAFASVMVGYVAAYRRPSVDHRALAQHLRQLIETAAPVFRQLGAKRATQVAAINELSRGKCSNAGGMPTPRYATILARVRQEMRSGLSRYYLSPQLDERLSRLTRVAISMLTPDTATVARKDNNLDRLLVVLPDRVVRLAFTPVARSDQAQHVREARFLVRKWTGRDDVRLGQEEAKRVKEREPERYKRYLQVTKAIRESWQQCVRIAAREHGGPVPVKDVIQRMKAEGIDHHPLDPVARLRISEDCKLYTPGGLQLHTPIPPVGSRIEWNRAYDPKTDSTYVFRFKVPNGKGNGMTKAYTLRCLRSRKSGRYDDVLEAIPNVQQWQRRWIKDLNSTDRRKSTLGALAEIMLSQAARPGGAKNAVDGETTYGMTTLTVGHCSIRNGTLVMTYSGKDAIQQRHVVKPDTAENKRVIQVVQKLMAGKKRSDPLWTDATGARITSRDLNAYLKSCGATVTAHKFRHIRGTMLMKELLEHARIPRGSTQPQVEKIVKGLAVQVGALLGHVSGEKITPMTSIKNYIVPDVIARFFEDRKLRVPGWLPKARAGGNSEE